jgi:hypothetical protein
VNDRRNSDPKSTINETSQFVVMWVLVVFRRNTTIDDNNQSEWMCLKIVWDTIVIVVAGVTVGCYRIYVYSTIYEIVAVGAMIDFLLTPASTAIDFFLDRVIVTVYQSGLLMQLGADDPDSCVGSSSSSIF